jgi:hypothetical protein
MSQENNHRIPNQAPAPKLQDVSKVSEAPQTLQVPEALQQELLQANDQLDAEKLQYANQALALRKQEQILIQKDQQLLARIAGFATAHGIDLTRPDRGEWTYIYKTGTLIRTK